MRRALLRPAAATVLAGTLALALYLATLAPTVGFVDSGELTLAAWELGVPHPPGFPFYILLAHLAASVPLGSIASRVNFASALFGAGAVAGVFQLAWLILQRSRGPSLSTIQVAGAATAALLFACLRTPWSYATIAEVYSLAAGLLALMWLLMFTTSTAAWRAAALVFGLSLGVHPAIAVGSLPALAVLVVRTKRITFVASREFVVLALIAIAGAASYVYLPLAAVRDPILNWGEPRTIERVWAHVSGWQYRGSVEMSAAAFLNALGRFTGILLDQFGGRFFPVGLGLAAIGAGVAWRRDRPSFWVLATLFAGNVLLTSWMNAGWSSAQADVITTEDIDAYYLPALAACAVFAGFGAASLLAHALASAPRRKWPAIAVTALAASAILQPMAGNWRVVDRHDDTTARTYVDDILRSMAPGGMLLLRDWQLSSPLMYVLAAERVRPDVFVLDLNLMERRWYTDGLQRRYPDVFAAVATQLATFRQRVTAWEDDPTIIQRDLQYRTAVSSAFEDLALALVSSHFTRASVYVTFEVATGSDGKGDALAKKLRAEYQLVPEGLVFRLDAKTRRHELPAWELDTTHIRDIAQRRGTNHVVSQRVVPIYRDMLISRGLYFEAQGRCADARPAYTQALAVDPSSTMASAALARCGGRR